MSETEIIVRENPFHYLVTVYDMTTGYMIVDCAPCNQTGMNEMCKKFANLNRARRKRLTQQIHDLHEATYSCDPTHPRNHFDIIVTLAQP